MESYLRPPNEKSRCKRIYIYLFKNKWSMGSNTSPVRDRKGKKKDRSSTFSPKKGRQLVKYVTQRYMNSFFSELHLGFIIAGTGCVAFASGSFCDYQDEARIPVASPPSDSDAHNLSGSPLYECKCLTLPISRATYRVTAAGSFHLAEA